MHHASSSTPLDAGDDIVRAAHERIRHNQGPGTDPEVAQAFWRELAAWPDWSEWQPARSPLPPEELERRDLA
jgi:hypothetical protein